MNYSVFLDNESSAFQKRFISLLKNDESQKYYADLIGTSPQNFNNWLKGKSTPDMNGLICISNTFGVSVDWLIGLSDIRSSNPTIKDICAYVGLNESTVDALHLAQIGKARFLKAFEKLCEDGALWTICNLIVTTSDDIRRDVDRAAFLSENIGHNQVKKEIIIEKSGANLSEQDKKEYNTLEDNILCMSAELQDIEKQISFHKWDISNRINGIISTLILHLAKFNDFDDLDEYEIDILIDKYEALKKEISEIENEIANSNNEELKRLLKQSIDYRVNELKRLAGYIRTNKPEYFESK